MNRSVVAMRKPNGVLREAELAGRHVGHGRDQTALQAPGGVDGSFVDGHLHGHGAVSRRDLLQAELIEQLSEGLRRRHGERHYRPAVVSLDVSARAGIVVTGTEVLTGRVQDRNGPWIADRLLELGVELAHITICGDRAARHRGAAAVPRRRGRGPDRHQRRPRADGRRHDGRDRGPILRPRAGARRRRSRSGSPTSSSD